MKYDRALSEILDHARNILRIKFFFSCTHLNVKVEMLKMYI